MQKVESTVARLREAEPALARATEKDTDKEPLIIHEADMKAKAGDWKGALALYPAIPRPEQSGWVGLTRATCQGRLGQKEAAKVTLRGASSTSDFMAERERLGGELGL